MWCQEVKSHLFSKHQNDYDKVHTIDDVSEDLPL